jgi:hypothetical protein
MSREWSVVLPLKDELGFLNLSLPSVLQMKPSEVVLCLDFGASPKIEEYSRVKCEEYDVSLKVLYLKRNPDWKFHQYYVRWMGYRAATYDKIFTFDVDCVLYPDRIMVGYDMIGKDNFTFVTFRKKLIYMGVVNSLRSALYEIRRLIPRKRISVNKETVPFIGIYWLYRPYYFNLIHEDVARDIFNGEDTLASYLITSQDTYKHIHMDEIVACWSLREGNEDLSWRQEQLGIYLGCLSRRRTTLASQGFSMIRLLLMFLWKIYPRTVEGYFIGRRYPESLSKKIRSQNFEQMIMHSKYTKGRWLFDYPD